MNKFIDIIILLTISLGLSLLFAGFFDPDPFYTPSGAEVLQ